MQDQPRQPSPHRAGLTPERDSRGTTTSPALPSQSPALPICYKARKTELLQTTRACDQSARILEGLNLHLSTSPPSLSHWLQAGPSIVFLPYLSWVRSPVCQGDQRTGAAENSAAGPVSLPSIQSTPDSGLPRSVSSPSDTPYHSHPKNKKYWDPQAEREGFCLVRFPGNMRPCCLQGSLESRPHPPKSLQVQTCFLHKVHPQRCFQKAEHWPSLTSLGRCLSCSPGRLPVP